MQIPIRCALALALLIGACSHPSADAGDVQAYRTVLVALGDALGPAPVMVQPNPVRVASHASAPGGWVADALELLDVEG